MKSTPSLEVITKPAASVDVLSTPGRPGSLVPVAEETQALLGRMFADPRLLEKHETAELVAQLRASVELYPAVSELRVLLGMALCVNSEVQAAMEELREGVKLSPNSFIAQLKMGELWMRLRVCDQAEDHTRQAALLARNAAQSDLARRQAATIRTMRREGVERNYNYKSPFGVARRLLRFRPWGKKEASMVLDPS
jgi:hypothetical protein